jgi:hypothetical protein
MSYSPYERGKLSPRNSKNRQLLSPLIDWKLLHEFQGKKEKKKKIALAWW